MLTATPTLAVGHVKWFNVKRGYGFITLEDGSQEIFVHRRSIAENNPQLAVPSLGDGESVEFNVITTAKGPEAVNVTGPRGTSVKGSTHAWEKKRSQPTPTTHGPQFGNTSYSILDVVIQTAMVLAGGDANHLRRLLPALLEANNLPVIKLPSDLQLSKTTRKKKTAAKTPQQLPSTRLTEEGTSARTRIYTRANTEEIDVESEDLTPPPPPPEEEEAAAEEEEDDVGPPEEGE